MNLLALLLGLAIERLLTHLFHLREFRWLDPLFALVFGRPGSLSRGMALALGTALALLLALPVAAVSAYLWDTFLQIPYFLFAVLVLLFSLGPRDLDDEVEDYCAALKAGDPEGQRELAGELLGQPAPEAQAERNAAVERAVFVQANNRVFGVVFWFLVLGPTGAWLFRVLDLLRRRAEAGAGGTPAPPGFVSAARSLHGLGAWLPARLLAAGYMLAGNFEEGVAAWRGSGRGLAPAEATRELLARVGTRASGRLGLDAGSPPAALERIRGARALVIRTLWMIWCPVIAVLTLYNWLS